MPWTFFFFPAIYQLPKRWDALPPSVKQLVIVNLSLFLFLTLSGSRRSYYILPMVPFALLLAAEWINVQEVRIKFLYYTASISFFALFAWFILFQPIYYSDGGIAKFSQQLKTMIAKQDGKKTYHIAFLNTDNRLSFYLPKSDIDFLRWDKVDINRLAEYYDIIITREADLKRIPDLANDYLLFSKPHRGNRWLGNVAEDAPVAVFSKKD